VGSPGQKELDWNRVHGTSPPFRGQFTAMKEGKTLRRTKPCTRGKKISNGGSIPGRPRGGVKKKVFVQHHGFWTQGKKKKKLGLSLFRQGVNCSSWSFGGRGTPKRGTTRRGNQHGGEKTGDVVCLGLRAQGLHGKEGKSWELGKKWRLREKCRGSLRGAIVKGFTEGNTRTFPPYFVSAIFSGLWVKKEKELAVTPDRRELLQCHLGKRPGNLATWGRIVATAEYVNGRGRLTCTSLNAPGQKKRKFK